MNVKVECIDKFNGFVHFPCDLTDIPKNIVDVAMETIISETYYDDYKELAQKVLDGKMTFEEFSKETNIVCSVDVNMENGRYWCVEASPMDGVDCENDGIHIFSCTEQELWYLPVKFNKEDKDLVLNTCEKEFEQLLKSNGGSVTFHQNCAFVKEGSAEYERD